MLRVIPIADAETIENLLKVLPEPSSVEVNIFGGSLVGEFVFKMDLPVGEVKPVLGFVNATLNHPSKEKIIKLVNYEGQNVEKPHSVPRVDFKEVTFVIKR